MQKLKPSIRKKNTFKISCNGAAVGQHDFHHQACGDRSTEWGKNIEGFIASVSEIFFFTNKIWIRFSQHSADDA